MTLEEIRKDIDGIDEEMLRLFLRRMECAEHVAAVKKTKGLPILNEKREREILEEIDAKAGEYGAQARILFSDLMAMSRAAQHRLLGSGDALRIKIQGAANETVSPRSVACLGRKGSFSHEAFLKLYPEAKPLFYDEFAAIFSAVENGEADLGLVPVENSSAGSVSDVYDLILKYRFSIVRALSLPIRHCLASSETDLAAVKKVYSHPQPIRQCSDYIAAHRLATKPFSSTAQAAMEAQKPGIAAICSEHAAREYGLNLLARDIQNSSGNCTRFIVISRRLSIPEEARKISLCFSLPHRTGTLYAVLSRFAAAGLNLTKIESRPIPGRQFEYDFYLDFTGSVRDGDTLDLLCALYDELPRFTFLGNYVEEE